MLVQHTFYLHFFAVVLHDYNEKLLLKIKSKERIGFVVVVFIYKSPGGHAIYRRNARVLEMQNFTPVVPEGLDGRTTFSEPKFLGCIGARAPLSSPAMVAMWTIAVTAGRGVM